MIIPTDFIEQCVENELQDYIGVLDEELIALMRTFCHKGVMITLEVIAANFNISKHDH